MRPLLLGWQPPLAAVRNIALRLAARVWPSWLRRRYVRLAHRRGVRRPHFLLSLDCDTDRDFEVVEHLHGRLTALGIRPVYAMPGELLEKGRPVYQRIASSGAEFLNHGYAVHTVYDPLRNSYESVLFYDGLTPEMIRQDISRGHETILSVLGHVPTGFRAPHFGTIRRARSWRSMYAALQHMGYRFSSSALPALGFWLGPVWKPAGALYEIPLSGCYDHPLTVLDSWTFRYAPGRTLEEGEYRRQFEKMLGFLAGPGRGGLFNVYADPSQVHDWPEFFACMEAAAPFAIPSYETFLRSIAQ